MNMHFWTPSVMYDRAATLFILLALSLKFFQRPQLHSSSIQTVNAIVSVLMLQLTVRCTDH